MPSGQFKNSQPSRIASISSSYPPISTGAFSQSNSRHLSVRNMISGFLAGRIAGARRPSRYVLSHKLPFLRVELRLRHPTQLLAVRPNQIRCQITIAQDVIKPELQTTVRIPHRKLAYARVQGRVVLEHWTSDACIVGRICTGRFVNKTPASLHAVSPFLEVRIPCWSSHAWLLSS